jgi:chromate transport protein ChrA
MTDIKDTHQITNLGIFSSLLIFVGTLYFSLPVATIYLVFSLYYYRYKEINYETYYNFVLINIIIIVYVIAIIILIKLIDSLDTIPVDIIHPLMYGY